MMIKCFLRSLSYTIFLMLIALVTTGRSYASSQQLSLPIKSNQLVGHYIENPAHGVSDVYLLHAYQKQTAHFNEQEATVSIKGEHFGANTVNADMAYYEVGHFSIGAYLYKLIIYNRPGESDTPLLNIQLNSYNADGILVDALLLDSRFGFEEFERFSEFTIGGPDAILIEHYITYLYELADGGEIGHKIEHPVSQTNIRELYNIDQGHFRLVSRNLMKSDPVQTSNLPQSKIWGIEHAKEMQKKAFNIGIPSVLDEAALLELVKHAWQWDKNAMIQYARIVENERQISPSKGESLDDFIIQYEDKIVNNRGQLLNEPRVLRLPFEIFMEKLAELKYPYPANYLAARMMGQSGHDKQGNFIPYDSNKKEKMLRYIRYSIDGGYRNQGFLADTILFGTGYPSNNQHYQSLHKLAGHLPNLTQAELAEAINSYMPCASHGSGYCMTRLAEANFYGIGVEKNLEQSYAWAELSNQGYANYLESIKTQPAPDLFEQHRHRIINNFNVDILEQISQEITQEQIEAALISKRKMEANITWDYEWWVRGRYPVAPIP